ncbi:TIGR01459 family HAD-type hydrolase [Rubellimicrobium roseum]|uniref:TIGR01459 family HAD-type hydrolase n=1 Tax=Rubellimicrobium roseum TaxID=687525 RepID=A0A5C4NKN2_9RHOB|nr:TIGR01459 family HAD-type hydrolase [Rubellimicrobium roseum]TNC74682.1 TIGR01459 family HAD-type hydrolase [Rubellimicrobium roseum]
MAQIVQSFAEIADRYDAAFVDLWGCMHNGLHAHPEAVEAMRAYRARGGKVVLVTNAPRPRASVEAQIERLGIPRDSWDAIATSGDAARVALFQGAIGSKVWFMGGPHDRVFLEPPNIVTDPVPVQEVPLAEAEGIVCCGPFDPHAHPDVNRPDFLLAKSKGMKLLCANPDIIVDRGEDREWCAGALAKLYDEMGGESLYFGKPHPPIYDLARRRLAALGELPPDERIVCVGDGIGTDILGAVGEGLDCLLVTGGLFARETGTDPGGQPDPGALATFEAAEKLTATYAIGFLR